MASKKEILKDVPEKNLHYKDTTSLKWKGDLIDFFKDKKTKSALEIGTHHGITAKMLSHVFKGVDTIEVNPKRFNIAKQNCESRDNINLIEGNAYTEKAYAQTLYGPKYNAVIIDCIHTHQHVLKDIKRALNYGREGKPIYLIFDDYGHPEAPGVHSAVNKAISIHPNLTLEEYIGEGVGFQVERKNGTKFTLIAREGVILKYIK